MRARTDAENGAGEREGAARRVLGWRRMADGGNGPRREQSGVAAVQGRARVAAALLGVAGNAVGTEGRLSGGGASRACGVRRGLELEGRRVCGRGARRTGGGPCRASPTFREEDLTADLGRAKGQRWPAIRSAASAGRETWRSESLARPDGSREHAEMGGDGHIGGQRCLKSVVVAPFSGSPSTSPSG